MVEDHSEGYHSNMVANSRFDDRFSPGEGYALKARKPYTITKQREKWTQEEHKKFLEALKLYGRSWRQIEGHVGNKTAVQIRSHAQKFFSKVVRESSGVDGTKGGGIGYLDGFMDIRLKATQVRLFLTYSSLSSAIHHWGFFS
ncbi:hypothetical protein L1987_74666 [Smallanthus sonchifolius]|uniref:Uncharacterized protein n=1 Tax=Smallanthus sonchifolius TaxID=185202 RepID=A0ACB9A3Z3_9ASTR|nr:hypothetical protein L1987_74666 [Smallanthus sonchifolius]